MLKNLKEDYVKTYKTKADTGRSMLEILAVLAIIGILSIAAITGYTYAMSKHKANQIYKQVDLRAVESFSNPALVNYEPGAKYNLIGFEKELSDISYSQEKGFNKKFYVIVKKVPVRVCKMLQKMVLEDFPIEREVFLCQGDLNATECMGAVSECEEGENNTFVFAYDIGVRGTLNIPDPDPEPDPCPNGKMFGSFCCHNEFIEKEECCTNDNETWKTDSKTCCKAKYHHWVNKETMVETETDDANGMCCINSFEYVFTSKDSMCCNLNQNLNQAVNNFYCCPKNYETLSKESTIEKKIACCKAAGRNWAFINEENFKCCEKDTEPVIVDSDIVCCPADRKKVINGTCCPFTATGVVDGECCTITKVVQDTDTGEEVTICCDLPSLDLRCSSDLDTDIPDNEEDCSALGGIWIGASNQCCTPSLIETNTNACCSKTGGKWSEEKVCTPITTQDGCIDAGGTWIPGENKCCSEEMIYYNTDSCCTKSGYYWDDESQVCSEEDSGNYDCTVIVTIPTESNYCISAINGGISNLEMTTYQDVYKGDYSKYYPTCLQYREGYHENNIGVACGKETNVPWYYPAEKECSLNEAGECYREFFFNECPGVGCYCSTNTYFKNPFPQQCVRWGSPSNSFPIRASGEEKAKAQLAAGSEPLEFCYLSKTLAAYFGEDSPTKNSSGLLYIGKWANVNENNLSKFSVDTYDNDYLNYGDKLKITLKEDENNKCNEGQVCSIASLGKGFIMENEGTEVKFLGKCVNQTNNY